MNRDPENLPDVPVAVVLGALLYAQVPDPAAAEGTLCKMKAPIQITYAGRTQTLADWSAELGLKVQTLYSRIVQYGWPLERAMTPAVFLRADQVNAMRERCKHGHPFTPENTYRNPKGQRLCRACNRARVAEWNRRARETHEIGTLPK